MVDRPHVAIIRNLALPLLALQLVETIVIQVCGDAFASIADVAKDEGVEERVLAYGRNVGRVVLKAAPQVQTNNQQLDGCPTPTTRTAVIMTGSRTESVGSI